MKHLILRSDGIGWDMMGYDGILWDMMGYDGVWWDMMGYHFRISLVNSCNVCRDVSRKRWPCREQTRDQLLRAQHSAASFSSSAGWFTSAAKRTDTKLTGELQAFSLKSSPETCLGRRSHAEDPPLHEACLPSLSTHKCFWTCNAAQHVFCPAIPKHEISMVHVEAFEQSSWACAAMRWLCCLSWGCLSCNYFNVKMGWLVLDLFFLQLVLLFLRKSLILFEFEGPQPLTGELLSHCSCHIPGRCNDRQRGARHDVLFCEHLLFVPWQIRKGTLGRAKLLFQNLWSWFKRPSFCLLLHWYEHPNHKLHAHVLFDTIFKLQYLGISEYSISFKSTFKLFYITRSNLSHSPEDAVILSPSPNEPLHTCIFLDLIGLS